MIASLLTSYLAKVISCLVDCKFILELFWDGFSLQTTWSSSLKQVVFTPYSRQIDLNEISLEESNRMKEIFYFIVTHYSNLCPKRFEPSRLQ